MRQPSGQPRLFEFKMGERSPATLAVTSANAAAAKLLTDWRAWPGGALALVGPKGSGKTHLALAWSVEVGARQLAANAEPGAAAELFATAGGRVLVEDADLERNESMLWRLLDLARGQGGEQGRTQGGAVLLTAAVPPAAWPASIPDLRSRLQAVPVARLDEPDEALLEVILRRECREQFILLSDDAVRYLLRRMPRTFAAARAIADGFDATIVHAARPATIADAKRALSQAQLAWRAGAEEG